MSDSEIIRGRRDRVIAAALAAALGCESPGVGEEAAKLAAAKPEPVAPAAAPALERTPTVPASDSPDRPGKAPGEERGPRGEERSPSQGPARPAPCLTLIPTGDVPEPVDDDGDGILSPF